MAVARYDFFEGHKVWDDDFGGGDCFLAVTAPAFRELL